MKFFSRAGFTLLELLVVISIIAILIGLSSVSYTTAQKKTRNSKRRGDIKAEQTAFEQYNSVNGAYAFPNCNTMAGSLPNGLPTDPKTGALYSNSCIDAATYCVCALLEGETGNSVDSNCNYSGAGQKTYYCLSQLQ